MTSQQHSSFMSMPTASICYHTNDQGWHRLCAHSKLLSLLAAVANYRSTTTPARHYQQRTKSASFTLNLECWMSLNAQQSWRHMRRKNPPTAIATTVQPALNLRAASSAACHSFFVIMDQVPDMVMDLEAHHGDIHVCRTEAITKTGVFLYRTSLR